MFSVAAGTQAWIHRIDRQPDLDSVGKEQNRNAVLVASTFLGAIVTGLLIVCIAKFMCSNKANASECLASSRLDVRPAATASVPKRLREILVL
jgi:hypothetical protein